MNLRDCVFSNDIASWIFEKAGEGTYLVGGYVRDCLIGRSSSDLDFAVNSDPASIARRTARRFRSTLIELEPGTCYRVVIKQNITLDFSRLKRDIITDLRQRDFTVNALAWSPRSGLVDPDSYLDDLRKGLIRTPETSNLTADPLRMLRAYRFSAQLGFRIDASTRAFIRNHADLIVNSAKERITYEILALMCSSNINYSISCAINDNVIHYILGTSRNKLLKNKKNLSIIEQIVEFLGNYRKYKRFLKSLQMPVNQQVTRFGLLRLYILSRDDPRNYRLLRFSKQNMRILRSLYIADQSSMNRLGMHKVCNLYMNSHDTITESVLLFMLNRKKRDTKYMEMAIKFRRLNDRPLLSGYEIANILGHENSRMIGLIKRELLRNRLLGKVRNRPQARQWILSNFT